jgi:hypothetical protein
MPAGSGWPSSARAAALGTSKTCGDGGGRAEAPATADARAGAAVRMVVVEESGPATRPGIGVGSSYADLSSAYPGAKVTRLPEWFDSRLTCRVSVPELTRLLDACGSAKGKVVRVVLAP